MRVNLIWSICIIFVVNFSLAEGWPYLEQCPYLVDLPYYRCPVVDSMAAERLRGSLMDTYNKTVLPPHNSTDPVKVLVGFSLVSIRDIDERLRNIELTGWLQLGWNDPRLRWDPKEHNATLSLRVGVKHLWKPEISLNNRADVPIDSPTDHAWLQSTGHVVWMPWSHVTASCVHNATYFPRDTLNCSLKFGFWVYGGAHLDLELYQFDLRDMRESNEWSVVSTSAKRTMRKYECCGESFADVTFRLTLERRTSIRKGAILFPLLSAFVLAVFAFIISPFNKQRLLIHAFDVIVLLFIMQYLRLLSPTFALNPPALVFICETTISIVVLAMVWNIGLMSIYGHCCKWRPPRWVQRLSQCWTGKELHIPQPDNKPTFGSEPWDLSHYDHNNVWMGFFHFFNYFVDLSFMAVLIILLYMFVLQKFD